MEKPTHPLEDMLRQTIRQFWAEYTSGLCGLEPHGDAEMDLIDSEKKEFISALHKIASHFEGTGRL